MCHTTEGCNIDPMEFMDRLRQAIDKAGIKQAEFARTLGVSVQTINYWLTGRNKPNRSRIIKISEILGCSPQWLEFGTLLSVLPRGKASNVLPELSKSILQAKISFVPLISWVTAGQWAEVMDNYPAGQGEDVIPCPSKCGSHSFALRVKGDSMEPEYPDGSVVVVDPDKEPRHNSDVVVRLNGDMEATFKRLKIDGSRWFLHPINERYPVIPLEGKNFTICGVVVWVGREVS